MKKQIVQIRLGLFFKSDYAGDFEKFSLELKGKIDDCKDTQHIPVPKDAPSQIPRFNLIFEGFNIQVAKSRLDIFSENFEKINENILSIFNVINFLEIQIVRIGFVKNMFIDGGVGDLKKILNDKFTDEDFKEINLRVNKRKKIKGFMCNNIEHIYTGSLVENNNSERKDGIVADRDLNTLSEDIETNNFVSDQVLSLINEFDKESNSFYVFE